MNKKRDKYVILLSLYAFFMPISRLLNVNSFIMVLLLLFFFTDLKKNNFKLINKKSFVLILFFGFQLFSLSYSYDISGGVKEISKLLPFLLMPLGVHFKASFLKSEIKDIFISFFLGNLVAFSYCLIHALSIYSENPVPLLKGFVYFTEVLKLHQSYFSIYLLLSFYSFYWLYKINRILIVFLSFFLFLILFYLKSKIALLIFFVIVLIELFKKIPWTRFILPILFIVYILAFDIPFTESIAGRNWDIAINERLSLWNSALHVIQQNLFLGVGVGDVQNELDKMYYLDNFYTAIDRKLNSHNQFFQTTLSSGFFGFCSLIAIFFCHLKSFFINRNGILLCFVISSSYLMLVESMLIRQHGIYFFTFFSTFLFNIDFDKSFKK